MKFQLSFLGHVLFVCPDKWHCVHFRFLPDPLGTSALVVCVTVVAVVDFYFGILGFGQVISAAKVDLQCCLICSYRYHFLSKLIPGMTFSGMPVDTDERPAFSIAH